MVSCVYFVRFLDIIPLGSKHVAWGCLSHAEYFSRPLFVWKERHNDSYFGLLIYDIRFNCTKYVTSVSERKYPHIFTVLSKEMQKGGIRGRVN